MTEPDGQTLCRNAARQPMMKPIPRKGDMRDMGVRGILVYCADYRCSHSIAINGDCWPDDVRLSDIEPATTASAVSRKRPAKLVS